MKSHLIRCSLIGALFVLSTGCRPSDDESHNNALGGQNALIRQSSDLKQTVVVATPDAPIVPGTNVIWCGTFQLAWNEACSLIGEDLHFVKESPIVAELNKKAFTSNELDSVSYVALAGFVRDGIHKKIRTSVAQKFGNSADTVLIPEESLSPYPDDIVAYAYLAKNLEFAVPFERLEQGMDFGGLTVAAFGMTGSGNAKRNMAAQVIILDGRRPDRFVIELRTKSAQDRLILAKIQPGKTLNETIRMVKDRIQNGQREGCGPEDELMVPKFNFDVTRTYGEVEHAELAVKNPIVKPGSFIVSAKQNIRFQMDEKGVKLKSEAHVAMTMATHTQLIFNRPFLVMLERADAKSPYFAMWVDNPEVLVQR